MFLQILGILFLLIFCVVVFFGWRFYRFVRKQTHSDISKALSVLPAQEMTMTRSQAEEWQQQDQLIAVQSRLKKVGSSHCGYFVMRNGQTTVRISLWDFKGKAIAAIYEVSSGAAEQNESTVSFMYEVTGRVDGGSISVASNAHAVHSDRPANHLGVVKQSTPIVGLLKSIKAHVPADKKLLKITDPQEFFLSCYEDTTEWAWQKEQINSSKTRQMLSLVGVKTTDKLMQELVDLGVSYSIEVNSNRARRKLAKHLKVSTDKWEKMRDKLVVVNEQMRIFDIVDAAYDVTGELSERQERIIDEFQNSTDELADPIVAFRALAQSLDLKLKRVTRMKTPIRTEIYLPL